MEKPSPLIISPSSAFHDYLGYAQIVEKMREDVSWIKRLENPPHNGFQVEVYPHLYLGTAAYVKIPDIIINVAWEIYRPPERMDIQYYEFELNDSKDDDIDDVCRKTDILIDNGLKERKDVLVHCAMGRSRSFTVVASYLIKHKIMGLVDIVALLYSKGWHVSPNDKYCDYLIDLEKRSA